MKNLAKESDVDVTDAVKKLETKIVKLKKDTYKNLTRWTKEIGERRAVKRGRMVNRVNGPPEQQLHERHDAKDFDTKTQDKIANQG